ncbi:hypothetical protein M493_09865 [Geobacillus genomosp. 3]|uniref:Uncharacterized protein n=1 Tax=Geobacillus genomosp. 3 TaxID=1921421 RepID=S5YZU9_GEOG3|nr:hypothetical protein M493_09865 [Geobacillus genomosp. 3]
MNKPGLNGQTFTAYFMQNRIHHMIAQIRSRGIGDLGGIALFIQCVDKLTNWQCREICRWPAFDNRFILYFYPAVIGPSVLTIDRHSLWSNFGAPGGEAK